MNVMTRNEAFDHFDALAKRYEEAKRQAKTAGARAQELELEAKELRERSRVEVDRALLDYATAHKQLRRLIDLESYDAERADRLLKSAETMKSIAPAEAKSA